MCKLTSALVHQSFETDMHILSISLSLRTCEPRQKICDLFMQTKSIVMSTVNDTLKACGDFVATANINWANWNGMIPLCEINWKTHLTNIQENQRCDKIRLKNYWLRLICCKCLQIGWVSFHSKFNSMLTETFTSCKLKATAHNSNKHFLSAQLNHFYRIFQIYSVSKNFVNSSIKKLLLVRVQSIWRISKNMRVVKLTIKNYLFTQLKLTFLWS